MKSSTKPVAVLAGSLFLLLWLLLWSASAAVAQVSVDPSNTPTENKGDWTWAMAILLAVIGGATVLAIIAMYMRFAPRFSTDEEGLGVVRADRVLPGREPPRRAVDLSMASPVVVAPPAVPVSSGAPASAPAAAAPAAPAAAAPAAEAPPAQEAAPAAEAPPAQEAAPAAAEAPGAEAPAAETAAAAPAPEAAAAAGAAPAAPPAAEHQEVTMDQEVFEKTLQELLDQGTDRRIAEGRARRAGMIAAKKASGEG